MRTPRQPFFYELKPYALAAIAIGVLVPSASTETLLRASCYLLLLMSGYIFYCRFTWRRGFRR